MLIDITSFISGPRQIENAVATPSNANQVAVQKAINGYIEYYQPIFLKEAVGEKWGALIDAYTRVDHEGGEDAAEPTDEEETIESLIKYLKEPFADYVFFHLLREMNTQATITGLVSLKCANDYVSPLEKGVRIWNDMVHAMESFTEEVYNLKVLDVVTDKNVLTVINSYNL